MTTAEHLIDRAGPVARARHAIRNLRPEPVIAVLAFLGLCVAVLMRAPQMLEPDDYAYRASIVALSQGHILLTNSQYQALARSLSSGGTASPGGGASSIMQWDHLANGDWISEKNPGYPFLAVWFQWLGNLRLAPLFYGALGCMGLYVGGRRWLGSWGGTFAVVLMCSSGAALAFAWRATMETFTDASLVAAGAGALLWTMLASEASQRRRCLVGLAGLLALCGATFTRYTDVIALGVAVVAVALLSRRVGITWRTVQVWAAAVVLFGIGVAAFDQYAYGAWDKTGYAPGEITFSLGAFSPNIQHMPGQLVRAMPMLLLGLSAVGWVALRLIRDRHTGNDRVRARNRRDGLVVAALGAGWLGFWALYLCYNWTAQMSAQGNGAIHVIRFYLPALGLIALLGAWTLVQLLRHRSGLVRISPAAILVALIIAGGWSYQNLVSTGGGAGGPGGAGGAPAAGSGTGRGLPGGAPSQFGGGTGGTPPKGGAPSGAPAGGPTGAPVPAGGA